MEEKKEFKGFGKCGIDNLAVQIIGGLVCSLVMDSGFTFNVWLISCIAYWTGFLFIRYRRLQNPSEIDTLFIQFGTFVIFIVLWFGFTIFGIFLNTMFL